MNGPRILAAVLAVGALLLWAALAGDQDADLRRGLTETDRAFAAVDDKLADLDPDYQTLRSQGLVLGLRETHDQIRSGLASLRTERVAIREDTLLDRRERLPRLRELVDRIDQWLARATGLHLTIAALVNYRKEVLPLLNTADEQITRLDQLVQAGDSRSTIIATLATSLTETHQSVAMAMQLIHQDVEQGARFGKQTLTSLRTIIEEQRKLLDATP